MGCSLFPSQKLSLLATKMWTSKTIVIRILTFGVTSNPVFPTQPFVLDNIFYSKFKLMVCSFGAQEFPRGFYLNPDPFFHVHTRGPWPTSSNSQVCVHDRTIVPAPQRRFPTLRCSRTAPAVPGGNSCGKQHLLGKTKGLPLRVHSI